MTDEHPLIWELNSLKAALDKYQHAAHISSLQLQRANLEVSDVSAHMKLLEAENVRLKAEVVFLRANPEPIHTPRQVTEFNLALRRLSDKLSLTEKTLLQRTTELAHSESLRMGMLLEVNAALAEAERIRGVENENLRRQRDLERKCKAAEEEARMADIVVMEYADLVRSLEAKIAKLLKVASQSDDKPSSLQGSNGNTLPYDNSASNDNSESIPQSGNLLRSLTENRASLQRLLHEFNTENTNLQAEITRLHAELSMLQTNLDTEREISRQDRARLSEALVEVDRCKTDDEAAGKIVSRYMHFSQSCIDKLQIAISTLKSRHAMTLATLSKSSEKLSQALKMERSRAYQLRDILDQLTEDISRETFGRRREVALRLRGILREEQLAEALRTWFGRAEERRAQIIMVAGQDPLDSSRELSTTLDQMIHEAHALLSSLSQVSHSTSKLPEDSSWGRIVLAEYKCRSLLSEVQEETERRLALARTIGETLHVSPPVISQEKIADPINLPDDQSTSDSLSKRILSDVVAMPSLGLQEIPAHNSLPSRKSPVESQSHLTNESQEIVNSTGLDDKRAIEEASLHIDRDGESPLLEETYILQSSALSSPEEPSSTVPSHSLLDELSHVSHRYDQLQLAFRDCHQVLSQLKVLIAFESSIPPVTLALRSVIHRLDDFCEDARVELEIQITDEERIARGFEAMLRVPGALAAGNEEKVRCELQSFVDGTAPAVVKTIESYTTKFMDLQHDIAEVKRVIHGMELASEDHIQSTKGVPIWSSWAPPFLKSTGSPSSAPTFGTVITTPRSSRMSSTSPSSTSRDSNELKSPDDLYSSLKLRIPMPPQTLIDPSPLQLASSRLRSKSSSSGIYLLGLGGSTSGIFSKQEFIDTMGDQTHETNETGNTQHPHSDVE